ncbi:DUF4232 domain-containing protein [Streptomyces sp. NPDC090083]|uniref:DUF4232 domain-containing protein n=1 Tax=Streptomyces sp. NPDC090083 TaxID=3365941 RepID=UPI0037FE8B5B
MSSTTFRRRTALLTAGFAAVASLALTAGGTGPHTGALPAPNTVVDAEAAAFGTTVPKTGQGTKASSAGVTCTGANTKVTARTVTRPVNHMLLTVKNTGSRTCHLYGYPALRFQFAQAVPPVVEDSQPQAVTTLDPGQSGYAGVNLSSADGSGTGGYTAKTLAVIFQNRALDFVGSGVGVPLPGKGVHIDSSLRTTYWLSDPQDALSW